MARRRGGLTKKQKTRLKQVAVWSGLGLLAWETFQGMIVRRQRRRDSFQAALNTQEATGKPLAVVGRPDRRPLAKIVGGDHDCADLCIDPSGCESCQSVLVAAYAEGLSQLPTNSHVLYVDTGIFERCQQPHQLAAELQRVSGGDLFMAPLGVLTAFAWLPPNKQRVSAAPPAQRQLVWKGWGGSSGRLQLAGAPRLRMVN